MNLTIQHKNLRQFIFLIFLFGYFYGCGSEQSGVGDSLSTAPHLQLNPIIEIRENDETLFSRLDGLLIDERENLLVADPDQYLIYYFTQDGGLLQIFGGQGEGPGEFTSIFNMYLLSDGGLIVHDISQTRKSEYTFEAGEWVFKSSEEFQRNFMDDLSTYTLHNGNLLINEANSPFSQPPTSTGLIVPEATYKVVDQDHRTLNDNYIDVKGRARIMRISEQSISIMTHPFPVYDVMEVCPKGYVYIGRNDELNVRKMDAEGNVVMTYSLPLERVPITSSDLEDYNREIREFIDDEAPVYKSINVSDNGDLWVNLYTGSEDIPNWIIFNEDGTLKGKILIPENISVYEVRENRLYTIVTDDLGSPHVAIFEAG